MKFFTALQFVLLLTPFADLAAAEKSVLVKTDTTITYSPAEGIGPETGVMRPDPSDITRDGDQFHVWCVVINNLVKEKPELTAELLKLHRQWLAEVGDK